MRMIELRVELAVMTSQHDCMLILQSARNKGGKEGAANGKDQDGDEDADEEQEQEEEEDEDEDEAPKAGDRMAASYINFYICNGGIVMPALGQEPADSR